MLKHRVHIVIFLVAALAFGVVNTGNCLLGMFSPLAQTEEEIETDSEKEEKDAEAEGDTFEALTVAKRKQIPMSWSGELLCDGSQSVQVNDWDREVPKVVKTAYYKLYILYGNLSLSSPAITV